MPVLAQRTRSLAWLAMNGKWKVNLQFKIWLVLPTQLVILALGNTTGNLFSQRAVSCSSCACVCLKLQFILMFSVIQKDFSVYGVQPNVPNVLFIRVVTKFSNWVNPWSLSNFQKVCFKSVMNMKNYWEFFRKTAMFSRKFSFFERSVGKITLYSHNALWWVEEWTLEGVNLGQTFTEWMFSRKFSFFDSSVGKNKNYYRLAVLVILGFEPESLKIFQEIYQKLDCKIREIFKNLTKTFRKFVQIQDNNSGFSIAVVGSGAAQPDRAVF